ncbi:MAG: phenylacetic acid degradation b [Bacteroidetes bacterium]|nr:phenylacetic acid degradation b [Bacteroidota bacterium]MBI3482683.1 phenylacetic acid degradation b [Bacteroidota bacterium]
MKSLDPRVTRLPQVGEVKPKRPLDQFGTFEVFVQPKEGKPFQHEGPVHAPNLEMAYILAKETFTRRFTCTSIYVVDTRDVLVSPTTEGNQSAYELITAKPAGSQKKIFEIYQLAKRGKQHVNAGSVEADSPEQAMLLAKDLFNAGKIVYNVWAIEKDKIRFTTTEEKDLWNTLPEKKFRDASDYKGGDKLKEFLTRSQLPDTGIQ